MAGGPNTHDNRDDNRRDGVADSGLVDSGLPERARLRLAPVTDPVLGLDGALLRISGLTIPLRPDAVWMDVRSGTRRL